MAHLSGTGDIAIIGMSCRVAGADSPSKLWELLASSRDVQSEITRFDSCGFYKATGGKLKGLTNVRHAYFMDEGIDRFDNGFFSIPPLEATAMDPQQRLLLELAYESLENAGIPLEDFQGTDTAVYAGIFTNDYGTSLLRDLDATPKYHSTGTSISIAANRISYFFNLHGASMAIDTACSSTMVALHQAVQSLKAKEAGMALVCGANIIINPDMFIHMSELGFLSPSGRCKSFDASGDGYARGEGVLAMLLKPLDRALKDGDPIRAVIRGSRINQDGRTQGITLPSSEAQRQNLESLYRDYNISPGGVQYLEAHGTGTAVGDPLEMSAVHSTFAEGHKTQKLVVGSIKSNVGHLEACAALAGIIKTVECLERGQIPPQMHFTDPNPKINFDAVAVPTKILTWPSSNDGIRRAAVNSFGFGGTNGHVVLEHFPKATESTEVRSRPFLFMVSAASDSTLQALCASYADYIETRKPPLDTLAHTLLARRSALRRSLFLTASTHSELIDKLRTPATPLTRQIHSTPRIGFLFTGQGAQWPEMGQDLLLKSRLFKAVIHECDRVLSTLPDRPDWQIQEEMLKAAQKSRINTSSFSQPICTALQLGLVELLKSWQIKAEAVLGHSSGEIGAAYAAGLLSLHDAIIIAYYRGLYLGTSNSEVKGAMCAVGLSELDCKDFLDSYPGRIALAAVNSPSSSTLSGDVDAIDEIVALCKDRGTFCRKLRVDMAFHSHHMLPMAPKYEQSMNDAGIVPLTPAIHSGCEMFSSVTQNKLSPKECYSTYWKRNMVSTVRFTAALTEAIRCHDLDVIVEIGPHPALKGPAMDTLAAIGKNDINYFGSCSRGRPDFVSLLDSVGEMINAGLPVTCSKVNAIEIVNGLSVEHVTGSVLTDLPKYQWDHTISHWAETRVSRRQRYRMFPRHQLLGARIHNDNSHFRSWRNLLILKEIEWLEESIAAGAIHLPSSAFILMAVEAIRQVGIIEDIREPVLRLKDVKFMDALPLSVLGEDASIETQLHVHRQGKNFVFDIVASVDRAGTTWTKHCTGTIEFTVKTTTVSTGEITHSIAHPRAVEPVIAVPPLITLTLNADCASGQIKSSSVVDEDYHIHPVALASLMQVPEILMLGSDLPARYHLEAIDSIEVPMGTWELHDGEYKADLIRLSPMRFKTDIHIRDESGHYISIQGLQLKLDHLIEKRPSLRSLFFKPHLLPDITYMRSSSQISILQVLELVTHKWPMSDIGVADVLPHDLELIRTHLESHKRPRFRSLNILNTVCVADSERVRSVEKFDKLHLLFSSTERINTLSACVRQNGLVCVRVESEDERQLSDHLNFVCDVNSITGSRWLLGRPKPLANGVVPSRKVQVFASETFDNSVLKDYGDLEYHQLTTHFKPEQPRTLFDLIILDCGPVSILTSWKGATLLPWLQLILEQVGTLLWVSNQVSTSPYSNVAGSFVRTVQAEHPSMKTASLVFKDNYDPKFFAKTVFEVYHDTTHSGNEVELVAQDSKVFALRYHPDDDLSASVGLIPPRVSTQALGSGNYDVSMQAPGKVVLLSERFESAQISTSETISVAVEASIVDHRDAVLYSDAKQHVWEGLGQFFAGRVLSPGNTRFPPDSFVVGWHIGAHKSKLKVAPTHLHCVPRGMSLKDAAARFAAYSTAYAVVEGAARARRSERFVIHVPELLAEALTNVCHSIGVIPHYRPQSNAEFVAEYNTTDGLTLNGRPVSIESYMSSGLLPMLKVDELVLRSPVSPFGMEHLQEAFDAGKEYPISTVLIHSDIAGIRGHIIRYKCPERLFREDAAYIMLGGLGGLGRYIAKWMIAHGAKHLITLSRSGLASDDAKTTVKVVQDLGAQIQVFKADASDGKVVSDALAKVRNERPIRGCLNLAMVLDNAPLMTMEPSQWDRALRTKVDATWNLHQSLLPDSLDFFIMFSSISSISGNRTQANYATGNAFQNAMAEYRRSLGLPAIAIALGVMSGIGVLANDYDLLRTLSQSGLSHLGPNDLDKIMEAAIFESQHPDRSLLSVGFEMFETMDDKVIAKPEQNQLFWTESPEFGFLLDHRFSAVSPAKTVSILEELKSQQQATAHITLLEAFLICLSSVLGYELARFDPTSSLTSYGLDSLNAVACRYWFFKQLQVDVPVFDILGCTSINALVSRVIQKLLSQSEAKDSTDFPQPIRHDKQSLQIRPISRSQSRLWFLHKFLPDKTVYNLLLVCHISGTVNVPLFGMAWSIFMKRHEVLRSKIVDTVNGMQQIPVPDLVFPLTELEISNEGQAACVLEKVRSYEFDIEAGELVHGWLLRTPCGTRFYLASHHLAWDRASVPTIFDETTAIYKALVRGEDAESALPPVPYQFIDYTIWQEAWMGKQQQVQPHIDYWKSQLEGIPEAVSLLPGALRSQRPTMKQHNTGSVHLQLLPSLTNNLKSLCKAHAVTPFMFMTSAISALIHRLTGDSEIIIGIADGDRGHTEFDRLVGFTVNMLAIRVKINKDTPYASLLDDYRNACLGAYEHRAVPFDYLLQQLKVPRRTSHSPVFQITVNYQMHGAFPQYDYGDFRFTHYDHYNAKSQSDLMLDIEETAEGELHCVFDFDASLYDDAYIRRFADTYKTFVENIIVKGTLATIDSIDMLSPSDHGFISSVLQPSIENEPALEDLDRSLFPTLFANAVTAFPTKSAILDERRCLTYVELDMLTNRVANFLIKQGATSGDRIGICCEQGVDMVVAMYGILKAGCVYVPIDPDFPGERIRSMMDDVGSEVVLVNRLDDKTFEKLVTCRVDTPRIHSVDVIAATSEDAQCLKVSQARAFCCIFTSGSTGRPKGIYLGQKQLRYQMEGYHRHLGTTSDDRLLLSSAMVFDMSLPAIYGTVLRGATMFIASREARYSPNTMVDQLVEYRISSCTFTSTQLKFLLTASNKFKLSTWHSLRSVVVGGEAIPPWVVRDFYKLKLPHASLLNGYAPSETTVCNSLRTLLPEDAERLEIPLERPLYPTRFHILDEKLNPVPIGLKGELYIGGPTVNEGYVKRDEITAISFLRDPFASAEEIGAGNGRLYRTGDSFRLAHDGTIHALGRIGGDRQVKIRGMRTELDEIENALWGTCQEIEDLGASSVSFVAVVYHKTGDIDGILAAYLASADDNVERQRSLKAYITLRIKATLPINMIPSAFVIVPDLPRTVTGKTDYKTMLTWSAPTPEAISTRDVASTRVQLNTLQSTIASIWKAVLRIDGDLAPWDEFFALGGHSLILLRIQEGIRETCGVTVSLGDMFANPTLQGMENLVLVRLDQCSSLLTGMQITSKHNLGATVPPTNSTIDWEKEGSLPEEFDWLCDTVTFKQASTVAMTGGCTMAGAHFLRLILKSTDMKVYCIGIEATDDEEARSWVLATLERWRLIKDIPSAAFDRMIVYGGSLSHPSLGLSTERISTLDREVNAIYQLDSEVSLLKRYDSLRASNVGSLHFLISLAHGQVSNTKAIHYLSTWGVPHLQAWTKTELTSPTWLTTEVEMTNMKPGADSDLGYLKCRWACESILYQAARRGIPVNIFRSCMCGGSPGSGVALDRTDINRRILEGSLQTGLVPDFSSEHGGGMSWITADFLTESMLFLAQRRAPPRGKAGIYHIVSDKHVPYTALADLLGVSHQGEKLKVVKPEKWFEALRGRNNPEMTMQAEVLEMWSRAGWVPFGLEAEGTLGLLRREAGLVPPRVEREILLKLAVGERGF